MSDSSIPSMQVTNETLSGWGNIPKSNSNVLIPTSIVEVAECCSSGTQISRGLGRSYADQATNQGGLVIKTEKLNEILSFDDSEGILSCGAGLSLDEIIRRFAPMGWFPMITPGTKYVTVGGAIANDVHGKAHHVDGSFINCVVDMQVMLANGQVVSANRIENSDLFFGSFGGLGLLGIILSARIKLRKIETTWFVQKPFPARNLEEMLDAIDACDRDYAYSVAWIDSTAIGRNLGRGVLTAGNHAKIDDLPKKLQAKRLMVSNPPKISVPFYLPNFALNGVTVKILNKALHIVQKSGKNLAHYESFFYPLDAIGNWNRGYGKRGFIQYQFVIPEQDGRKNIRNILTEITQSGCVPFLNVLKKFGDGSQMLSFPKKGYTFAIDFPVTSRLQAFTRRLDKIVLEAGGRIYLGKDAYLDADTFRAMYPEYKAWLEVKRKYDPDNVFSSDISRRLKLSDM